MKQTLKNKIKQIIYSTGGFPGQNKKQYIKSVKDELNQKLSTSELDSLKKINIDVVILEITEEIAQEIL